MRIAAWPAPLVCVALCGCGGGGSGAGRYPQVDVDDPSVLLDEPFRTTTGAFNQNGTAFDRAEIDLGEAGVVWLPEVAHLARVEVLPGSAAGRVVVDLEKRWHDGSHTKEGSDIRKTRKRIDVRVARPPGAVLVAVDRGWGHKEGGMTVTARAHVPPGVRVERGDPPAAGAGPLTWETIPQTPVPVPEAKRSRRRRQPE